MSIVSAIYVVNDQQNAELFWPKKLPPSANAEDFEQKTQKKLAAVGLKPGIAVSQTTTLPTTPSCSSLVNELKIAYMKLIFLKKNSSYKFFSGFLPSAFAEGRAFFFLPKNSAFAEGGSFFCQKKLRILLIIYYINCRYDRRFTEGLRPPHFWQTDSN